MESREEIHELLAFPKNIVILAHRNPDGDAVGSSLALKSVLDARNHHVKVLLPSDFPVDFNFLKGSEDILIYDLDRSGSRSVLDHAEVIFCLDFNSLERVDPIGSFWDELKAKTIMIDHHIDPEPFVDISISRPEASSTSEMVYDFIDVLGWDQLLTPSAIEALYTGIVTDTGSFKHNTNPHLFEVVGKLKSKGLDDNYVQDKIFNQMSEKQLRIIGRCLGQRMEIIPEYSTGIIYLDRQDFAEFNIDRGDTETIVQWPLRMKGIKVAVFVRELYPRVRISFRSKGDISVQELAKKYFNGGGHKNAAGGQSDLNLKQTIEKIKEVLPSLYK